jgi:hypothetical protein
MFFHFDFFQIFIEIGVFRCLQLLCDLKIWAIMCVLFLRGGISYYCRLVDTIFELPCSVFGRHYFYY